MAYQDIKIPRFYCNVLEFLHTVDKIDLGSAADLFMTLPVLNQQITNNTEFLVSPMMSLARNFYAILNWDGADINIITNQSDFVDNLNIAGGGSYGKSGFIINKFTENIEDIILHGKGGSLITGTYYDMDQSPNLSLTMERQYSHSEETISYNGSSFSNTMGENTPPAWGDLGAWELAEAGTTDTMTQSGRRVWSLEFSFLDSKNIFGSNQMVGNVMVTEDGYDSNDILDDTFKFNLLTDDNFFSQVYHRTLGGTIPFIFQPDNDYTESDGFAIARIKDNSIKLKQTAPNYYDISMVIEETF